MMALRMFPLGGVHYPYTLIPLRVFEPRYRQLVDEVQESGEPFGVVLIERGFEVGGGDSRFSVGTSAEILETSPLDDGTLAVVARGMRRIRIETWLEDDPYPRADIVNLNDEHGAAVNTDLPTRELSKLRALLSELGADMGTWDADLPDDPVIASYHLAALTPVGPLDAQRLLEAPTPAERIDLVTEMTRDLIELAEAQLSGL